MIGGYEISLTVILLTLLVITMKLSELNGRLVAIEKKVDTLLSGTPPADPDVPQEAVDTLDRLDAKLAAITPAP
jgi:hypothetical protein